MIKTQIKGKKLVDLGVTCASGKKIENSNFGDYFSRENIIFKHFKNHFKKNSNPSKTLNTAFTDVRFIGVVMVDLIFVASPVKQFLKNSKNSQNNYED